MGNPSRAVFLAIVAASLTTGLPAYAQTSVTFDLNHTTTNFSAKHLLISTVRGNIPVRSVSGTLGPDDIPESIDAVMDLTKLDTHNEKRDDDLRSPRFLEVQKYPEMTFKSTKIVRGAGNAFVMNGNLTIHGITKPIVVNGVLEGSVKDKNGRTHVGYSATATIDRRLWDVGTSIPEAVVGNDIAIAIEAEAIL